MVILDRSDMIIAAFWIPVITVKIAGSLYIVVYSLSFLHSTIDLKAMYTLTGMFSVVCIINIVISLLLPFHLLIVKSKALFGAKAKH